jgi:micrococcal nuclease
MFRVTRVRIALAAVVFSIALSAEQCSGAPPTSLPVTARTATATATATPAATPTEAPAPLQPPVAPEVTFPNGPASGRPGQTATLTAHYGRGVSCGIVVRYKSGPSQAKGLGPKITNGAGLVSWSWFIGTNTTRGQWPIDVTCGSASGRSFINVV